MGYNVKAEVFNASFTSAFKSQTSYSQGTLPPDLEVSDGEQNNPRIKYCLPTSNTATKMWQLETYFSGSIAGRQTVGLDYLGDIFQT